MGRVSLFASVVVVCACSSSSAPATGVGSAVQPTYTPAPGCYHGSRPVPTASSALPLVAPPSGPSAAGPLLGAGLESSDAAAMASSFSSPSLDAAPSLDIAQRARSLPAGPVTEIRIDKSDHRLELRAGDALVKSYKVAIGPGGSGPKRWEWDMVTPVGTYRVTGRFKGTFHQFLGVSYPNRDDLQRYAELKARGAVPAGRGVGDSIGIHGGGSATDWTAGCIALQDAEIDEISAMVRDGTRIVITD